jgi:hypothetical protein
MKDSKSDIRFILGFPFGLIAETFARLAIWVSSNQLTVNFDYLIKERALHKRHNDVQ